MRQYDTRKLNIDFLLTSSHTEVSEGESFTITLNALGPDVKEGLKIPYRVVGDVRESDYIPSEEYGLFVLNENFTSEVTFKIRSDGFNEEAENFTLTLYYYPEINITTVISRNVIVVVEPPPENTIKNFDYAVIRYKWVDLSGLDLDTKTQVISPYSDTKVGWNENVQYGNYLKWGGDNVNAGVESVLLNLKALKEDNPLYTGEFKISLGGYWFNIRRSGDIILEFQTYYRDWETDRKSVV